jgi:hypothetical protein
MRSLVRIQLPRPIESFVVSSGQLVRRALEIPAWGASSATVAGAAGKPPAGNNSGSGRGGVGGAAGRSGGSAPRAGSSASGGSPSAGAGSAAAGRAASGASASACAAANGGDCAGKPCCDNALCVQNVCAADCAVNNECMSGCCPKASSMQSFCAPANLCPPPDAKDCVNAGAEVLIARFTRVVATCCASRTYVLRPAVRTMNALAAAASCSTRERRSARLQRSAQARTPAQLRPLPVQVVWLRRRERSSTVASMARDDLRVR